MKSGQVKYDSNPYPQIDDAEIKESDKSKLPFILVCLSLLSYIVACLLPLEFDGDDSPGFLAIIFGIAVPLAWIPNPLYYIGWVLACIKCYILAIAFALLACIWSIFIVFSGEFGGPAMIFWCMSMLILVIACFTGNIYSKR